MTIKIVKADGKRPEDVSGEMAEKIHAVIEEYTGRTTVAATVGVLHIVAREIMDDHT